MAGVRVAYLISDHGFGHAGRTCSVIAEMQRRNTFRIRIVSSLPSTFFEEFLPTCDHLSFCPTLRGVTDVGFCQTTALEGDIEETLKALDKHSSEFHEQVDAIVKDLRNWQATIVAFDVPALAPVVASHLDVPSVAITNFWWDEEYVPYMKAEPRFAKFARLYADAYSKTTLWLRVPYSIPSPSRASLPVKDISWFGRRAHQDRGEVRSRLQWDSSLRYLLFSFGGFGLEFTNPATWSIPEQWRVVLVVGTKDSCAPTTFPIARRIVCVQRHWLHEQRLSYVDLLAAVDVVLTKPGWGTVSECIVNQVPGVVYALPRETSMIENRLNAQALSECLGAEEVSLDEVLCCDRRIFDLAERSLHHNHPKDISIEGAREIADVLEHMVQNPVSFYSSVGDGAKDGLPEQNESTIL